MYTYHTHVWYTRISKDDELCMLHIEEFASIHYFLYPEIQILPHNAFTTETHVCQ